jgi:hypothetical protein
MFATVGMAQTGGGGGDKSYWKELYYVDKGSILWTNMSEHEFYVKGRIGFAVALFSTGFRFTYDGVLVRKDGFTYPLRGWFPVTLEAVKLRKAKGLGNSKAGRVITLEFQHGDCCIKAIKLLFEIEMDDNLNILRDVGKGFADVLKIAVESKLTKKLVSIPCFQ